MDRLQKYLARAGIASRRGAERLILDGRVAVNGKSVTILGTKIDPDQDEVTVDGKTIALVDTLYYLLMNKPSGFITTADDERGRKTVLDLVTTIKARLYPIGRLDANTEGLLLLTNDGDLAYKLTHPRFGVPKMYRVILHGRITEDVIRKWRDGVELEDGFTSKSQVELRYAREDLSEIEVTIHEGKNRQIRRMAKATGYHIYHLERIRYAFLTLEGVKKGDYRHLSESEVQRLKELVG